MCMLCLCMHMMLCSIVPIFLLSAVFQFIQVNVEMSMKCPSTTFKLTKHFLFKVPVCHGVCLQHWHPNADVS